jgi:HAD superfamily hydrolase (TIGR01509 family)
MDVRGKAAGAETLPLASGLGLILDLDGVVVDSMPVHRLAWQSYVQSLGIDPANLADRMHGRRNDQIIREFLGPDADVHTVQEYGAAKERLFRNMLRGSLREHLVPGIAEWLDRAQGLPLALATNAERANLDFILDGAELRRYFQVLVDGSQVAHPKPAPDLYQRAAGELKIPPRNCIVFEDSPVGIAAARAAGARVVGILTHASSLADVDFSTSDFARTELDEWLSVQRPVPL